MAHVQKKVVEVDQHVNFSDAQQLAIMGAALADSTLFDHLKALGAEEGWWNDPGVRSLYQHVVLYHNTHNGWPNETTLRSWVQGKEAGDANAKRAHEGRIDQSVEAAQKHKLAHLTQKLDRWGRAQAMKAAGTELIKLYNDGNFAEAEKAILAGADKIRRIQSGILDGGDRLMPAIERARTERAEREENSKKVLKYGIDFLDLAIHGIYRDELILWGGRTGSGKTEAARIVAGTNALAGYNVVVYALEASRGEYERRIKYEMLAKEYYEQPPEARSGVLEYDAWHHFKSEHLVGKFNDEVEQKIQEQYGTLKTYYKEKSQFSPNDLERELGELQGVDLVVIDHFHYLDMEGHDANGEATKAIMALKRLQGMYKIPILLLGHLNKAARGKLVPDLSDFMGTGNLGNVVTTSVIIAKGLGALTINETDLAGMSPTFMRIAKNRVGGNKQDMVGLVPWDYHRNRYHKRFGVGDMSIDGAKWRMRSPAPHWTEGTPIITEVADAA